MAVIESLTSAVHATYFQTFPYLVASQPLLLIYLFLSCAIAAWLISSLYKRFLGSYGSRPRSPDPEKRSTRSNKFKAPDRAPGTWEPIDFKRPAAPPYPNWDVQTTKPLPYRPFRWGSYHITMGLRTMKWDEWIELDNQFPKFHADKVRRIEERGPKCSKTAPEAFDGACELLEEL